MAPFSDQRSLKWDFWKVTSRASQKQRSEPFEDVPLQPESGPRLSIAEISCRHRRKLALRQGFSPAAEARK
jgi:hypothetical protein